MKLLHRCICCMIDSSCVFSCFVCIKLPSITGFSTLFFALSGPQLFLPKNYLWLRLLTLNKTDSFFVILAPVEWMRIRLFHFLLRQGKQFSLITLSIYLILYEGFLAHGKCGNLGVARAFILKIQIIVMVWVIIINLSFKYCL